MEHGEMGRQLFGTDGIRGAAGSFPLDPQTAHAVGIAVGRWAARAALQPDVIVGMDTRESSPWLAGQVAGGLARGGARPHFAGLITTPGVACLTRTDSFAAGVMISASHNPYHDNGIKIFGHSGYKLPDEQERELEGEIFKLLDAGIQPEQELPGEEPELRRAYGDYLVSTFPDSLDGLTMAVDCANGAASNFAPEFFERLGAAVHRLGCSPDGRNINLGCGALDVEALRRETMARQADLGVAFDGDADRAIFVSPAGRILDGDAVLFVASRFLLARGELPGPDGYPTVVATVMSNLGLEKALQSAGVRLIRTPVGDKYVLEEMLRCGAQLGGEQSGHVIFRRYATTGDGLLTALRMAEVMRASSMGLGELAEDLILYPQRLVNVPVRVKKPLEDLPGVAVEIQAARQAFGETGRVLVRFSGTELLARVMVEAPDAQQVLEVSSRIAGAIQRSLGFGEG